MTQEKINIAEILKDCPKGMELDCTMYDNLSYDYIDKEQNRIFCKVDLRDTVWFTIYGCVNLSPSAKCVIFPKGKTTWKGFVPPCKFKDGDIIFVHTDALKCNLDNSWVSIFKEYRNNRCACYMCLCLTDLEFYHDKWEDELLCELCEMEESRLATEEEKEKLFQAIKDNGYKWNPETKTLEKLITRNKFQIGAKITNGKIIGKIRSRDVDSYQLEDGTYVFFNEVHKWELAPNKFDIPTLNTFDKVLVRHNKDNKWCASFFSHTDKDFHSHCYKYVTTAGKSYPYCIPYEANKELCGTTNDCDEYYKTWE